MRRLELLERLVVRLLVEQHRRQAQPRQVAQVLRRRSARPPTAAAPWRSSGRCGRSRSAPRPARPSARTACAGSSRRARRRRRAAPWRRPPAPPCRASRRAPRPARLVALVHVPVAPAGERQHRRHDHGDHQVAVRLPPRLQLGELLLLFQIQCHLLASMVQHSLHSIHELAVGAIRRALRRAAAFTCTHGPRSISPTMPATTRRWRRPFFICDLKLPPSFAVARYTSVLMPSPRSRLAARQVAAERAARP